ENLTPEQVDARKRWPVQFIAVVELCAERPETFYLENFLQLVEFLKWIDRPLRTFWEGDKRYTEGLKQARKEMASGSIRLMYREPRNQREQEDLAKHREMWLAHVAAAGSGTV